MLGFNGRRVCLHGIENVLSALVMVMFFVCFFSFKNNIFVINVVFGTVTDTLHV